MVAFLLKVRTYNNQFPYNSRQSIFRANINAFVQPCSVLQLKNLKILIFFVAAAT